MAEINAGGSTTANQKKESGGSGLGALLGALAVAGAGYAAYKGIQNHNEEIENERLRQIAERRRAERERMKNKKSPFWEFVRSVGDKMQEVYGVKMNEAAEMMYRKCHGNIPMLQRIARGEDPRVSPEGVKAAQLALKERNYRW